MLAFQTTTTAPMILSRPVGVLPEDARPHAGTKKVAEVTIPFCSGAQGVARVEMFRSLDDEDGGGVVLRLTLDDHGCSLLPTAQPLPNGIELHLTGDAEADAMMRAITAAIAADRRH